MVYWLQDAARWIWRWFKRLGALTLLGFLLFAVYLFWRLQIDRPETFADPVAQFKYGSTGGDKNFGIPYSMWQAMPVLFKDLLPKGREHEGWAALGFLYEDKEAWPPEMRRPRPVGTSLRNYWGIERTFLNCAGCHAGSVRTAEAGKRIIYAGMPANTLDLSAFQTFLKRAAMSERFTPERFLAQIDAMNLELGFINRLALRYYGVALARTQILLLAERFSFLDHEPAFGPGRFDTFNPAKALLNWNFEKLPETELIGVVDFPAVWLQEKKAGMQLHWDGNNTSVRERNRSAAFGTGATPATLDRGSIGRMEDWLAKAEPPKFADVFPNQLDRQLAQRGVQVFADHCARCHGKDGRNFAGTDAGTVVPIEDIGTDRSRFDNYTYELSLNQNVLYPGSNERFQNFRKTEGYASMPLDGIWLRAPYLHNGSVPTLHDLLQLPSERPRAFLRGHDVYDPVNVGFESRPEKIPAATRNRLFCFVTHASGTCGERRAQDPAQDKSYKCTGEDGECKGNGNGGHLYGTALTVEEKRALIEHLKTF